MPRPAPLPREDRQSLLTPPRVQGAHTDSAATMVPNQSRAERTTSYDVADFPLPTGREEEWRFTPVDRLAALFRDEASGAPWSGASRLPDGVTLGTASVQEWRGQRRAAPGDRAAAVAAAHSGGVAVLDVPAEAELDEPVRIQLTGTRRGRPRPPARARRPVRPGHRRARATGHLRLQRGVSVVVGDGAQPHWSPVQEWDDDAHHLGQHDLVIGRDARCGTSP